MTLFSKVELSNKEVIDVKMYLHSSSINLLSMTMTEPWRRWIVDVSRVFVCDTSLGKSDVIGDFIQHFGI